MLAFPCFILLKLALPETEVHVLVPEYTRDMADACTAIDKTIYDPGPSDNYAKQFNLLREINSQYYDAVLTLYSTT